MALANVPLVYKDASAFLTVTGSNVHYSTSRARDIAIRLAIRAALADGAVIQ